MDEAARRFHLSLRLRSGVRRILSAPGQRAGDDRRAAVAWVLYDFANSPFTTLVITFIYATYFTEAIAADRIEGTVLWSRAVTITALIVAVCSPVLGAVADSGGLRKTFLFWSTLVSAAATAMLYWVLPGQVLAALVLVVVANVAFEFGTVFYNAFLPDVSTHRTIGTVSGWGWGTGYVGGLLALIIALFAFIQTASPWFGFATDGGENVRATNLLVAVWFVLFSLPFFVFVPSHRVHDRPAGGAVGDAMRRLGETFRQIRRHRETVKFLIARLIYNDGLVTIFAFGGIYAAGTFGFETQEVIVFGIVLNLAAGIGSIAMGYLDDRIGAKRTIVVSLLGLMVAAVAALLATDRASFWAAGIALGIFVGPNQSASRSLMGRIAPADMKNEFFGFFALSGKLTAFIGPFLFGVVTEVWKSQRAGVAVVLSMFVLGLALMARVHPVADEASA